MTATPFTHADQLRVQLSMTQNPIANKAIVNHHVRVLQHSAPLERQQFRVSRSRPHQPDFTSQSSHRPELSTPRLPQKELRSSQLVFVRIRVKNR